MRVKATTTTKKYEMKNVSMLVILIPSNKGKKHYMVCIGSGIGVSGKVTRYVKKGNW